MDCERSLNYYPEVVGAGTPKVESSLPSRPGLTPYVVLPEGPVTGLFYQDGRAFAVAGTHLYEFYATHTYVVRGTVLSDGNPATIDTNGSAGHQLFIVSGGRGYMYDLLTNTLTQITTEGFAQPCLQGAFVDGYFVALKGLSNEFHLSALEDGATWDALSVAQVSESSNQLLAMIADHRELHFFGSKTTEIWYDAGDPLFPLAPIPGSFIESGIIAPFSAAAIDQHVIYLGGDARGAGVVYMLDAYIPKRISTHAIDTLIQSLDDYTNAIAWTYQEDGHSFYVLLLPNAETTPVYDLSTGEWSERAMWNTTIGQWEPYIGRCHAFAFGTHVIGSRTDGAIYEQSLRLSDDGLTA